MSQLIFKEHHSQLDQSVNFECRVDDGMIEARFVRRVDDYFIIYLSSQTGCEKACRMCWLTATGQNKARDVTVDEYLQQAGQVMQYYAEQCRKGGVPAKMVHFNFMARGEPLANKIFLDNADEVLERLADLAMSHGLEYKFLISTIIPHEVTGIEFYQIFKNPAVYPEIYYSIYSMNPKFRKRWLPKALNPEAGLDKLFEWQQATGKKPKIHYAFIDGENDSLGDVKRVVDAIKEYAVDVNWNIVRYNPPVGHYSKEPVEGHIQYLAGYIRSRLPDARVKVIPRVGTDVQASCGTFLK
uniref:RNA methyltransferase n=1 Tax=Pseudomonas phage RVTF4 TaxID=3236931 RepID=A0AB39CCP4_9VIRU